MFLKTKQLVEQWLVSNPKQEWTTTEEILRTINPPELSRRAQEMAVANLLQEFGWQRVRTMRDGIRKYVFYAPNDKFAKV